MSRCVLGPLVTAWRASLIAQLVKNPPAMRETWVCSLDWEDPLEKGKATHSSILAWRIPRTVQSIGSQRVGRDSATFTVKASPSVQSLGWPAPASQRLSASVSLL